MSFMITKVDWTFPYFLNWHVKAVALQKNGLFWQLLASLPFSTAISGWSGQNGRLWQVYLWSRGQSTEPRAPIFFSIAPTFINIAPSKHEQTFGFIRLCRIIPFISILEQYANFCYLPFIKKSNVGKISVLDLPLHAFIHI
jgi:hypothetical protein